MSFQLKVFIFIGLSVIIVFVSRKSLRNFRSHGFYRLFAFESITALILLNLDYWFYNPFSILHIISWLLLIISGYLVIHGFLLLYKKGNQNNQRRYHSLLKLEKTTKLVTAGIYRYIRHPLYSSLFFLGWGVFFKQISFLSVCLVVAATVFLTLTAKIEEAENLSYFGDAYKSYMKKTKMFIPFLF
ncbi:isoprenylcysteine carboxyl methyltransferase (ICMT) family protein [bacterium BMS3Abin03]|nr:isoprenylcysteine carboxyl methyltransferase (ICMT) family protein [bacterium BMS3Abin03]HDZ58780.1 isoprenylcysteine carboxylmethyltransferase family protein [Ignavibacteriales bacterium]